MPRRERLLTPIEILLVVAIVAVLALLMASNLDERVGARRASMCIGHLRQLHSAFAMYAADHNGAFPSNRPQSRRFFGWESPWPEQIAPYLKDRRAFRCPGDDSDAAPYPDSYRTWGHVTSYMMNQSIGWKHSKWTGSSVALKQSDIEAPDRSLLLTDREAWHFKRSQGDSYRNVLFVDGRVLQRSDEDVRDNYLGQLGINYR